MKTLTCRALTGLFVCLPFFFFSCKKDSNCPVSNAPRTSSDEISDADAPGIYTTMSGYTKLVLQPGEGVGQDTWIDFFNGEDSALYNNDNAGSIDQFKCNVWTMLGGVVKERTLIRFDELSQVPSQSQLIEAKMFLYGLSESPIHLPQGNSYYPGSPYNVYGPNDIYVQKITSPWDENSVTWNTRPSTTVEAESLIPPSKSQWNNNTSVDVTKMVRYFVNNSSVNYGFMLSFTNENIYRSMGFCSSENSDASKRPKLVILYK
jgi:hypothetical protein